MKPAGVFKYFEEICQVPRPSKKEEKMIAYLKAFGAKHNLETKVDEAGNVLIKKPATPGKENLQTVVLQSHIDMVCEKNNDVQHDFLTDPIETEIDGEWLKAKGTTLGADNGIGVATELAILADDSIEHGPLECLFTVDEETGLTGAFALKEGFMSGDILLNLDSEDEGEIFIGCAGGIDSVAEFTYKEVVNYIGVPIHTARLYRAVGFLRVKEPSSYTIIMTSEGGSKYGCIFVNQKLVTYGRNSPFVFTAPVAFDKPGDYEVDMRIYDYIDRDLVVPKGHSYPGRSKFSFMIKIPEQGKPQLAHRVLFLPLK